MKKTPVLLAFVLLTTLGFGLIPEGNAIFYVSAGQEIISPSPARYTLFRLNVTFPYEAKVGEDFNILMRLWQGSNTSVYVDDIDLWMYGNITGFLIKHQNLLNPANTDTLVVNRTLAIKIGTSQRLVIGLWYSVKDHNFGETWTTGSNQLASVHVYPQTYSELTTQLLDMRNQLCGFAFLTVYLLLTFGLVLPLRQKRKKRLSETPVSKS